MAGAWPSNGAAHGIYDAVLCKAKAIAHLHGLKDWVADLQHIHDEEIEHADLLKGVIEELGGDPTMETPCAGVEGVMSSGLLQVVHDPRTTLLDGLKAAAVAELADLENWTSLIEALGGHVTAETQDDLNKATTQEREHLAMIRRWVAAASAPAGVAAEALASNGCRR